PTWCKVWIKQRSSEQSEGVRAAENAARGHCGLVLAPDGDCGSVLVLNGTSTWLAIGYDLAVPHSKWFEDGTTEKIPIALLRRSFNHAAEDAVPKIRIVKTFARSLDDDTEPIDNPVECAWRRRSTI